MAKGIIDEWVEQFTKDTIKKLYANKELLEATKDSRAAFQDFIKGSGYYNTIKAIEAKEAFKPTVKAVTNKLKKNISNALEKKIKDTGRTAIESTKADVKGFVSNVAGDVKNTISGKKSSNSNVSTRAKKYANDNLNRKKDAKTQKEEEIKKRISDGYKKSKRLLR